MELVGADNSLVSTARAIFIFIDPALMLMQKSALNI